MEEFESVMIGIVGGLIFVEAAAHVLDVESRLVAGVIALDELFKRGRSGDDHQLIGLRA